MEAKRELEKIVTKAMIKEETSQGFSLMTTDGKYRSMYASEIWTKKKVIRLVQAILDAGFVRFADVEIDVKKLAKELERFSFDTSRPLLIAKAIASAKPIRVKEGK